MKTRYPNVTVDPDRHGKLRARYRKRGQRPVYLKHLPDEPGFKAELEAIRTGCKTPEPRHAPGTVHDLVSRYYRCPDFAARGNDDRRRVRRGIIESFRAEYGSEMVVDFGFQHIEAILLKRVEKRVNEQGRAIGGQASAATLREELLRLFRYARKLKWRDDNPVEDAEKVGVRRLKGYHSWTEAEIEQYQTYYGLGSKARLALEIILWTGQRRGNAATFGPKHIVRGKINYKAIKNGPDLWLPIAPDLQRAISAMSAVGIETFLVTDYGRPFSVAGFGNKIREWCNAAGLPQCSAHGLRKAIGRRAALSKATQQGIKSIGGWKKDEEVRTYVEAAEQEQMADEAMGKIIDKYSGDSVTGVSNHG